jgi:hypothetical protein
MYGIHNNNKISVKLKSDLSDWRPINRAWRQGCGVSCFTKNVYG